MGKTIKAGRTGRSGDLSSTTVPWHSSPMQDVQARVFGCFTCGQFHLVPDLAPGSRVRCRRCRTVLVTRRRDPLRRTLAWGLAATVFFVAATTLPFMRIDLYGRARQIVLDSGPTALDADGLAALGVLIFFLTIAAPAVRILGLVYVTLGLHLRHPPHGMRFVLRLAERLRTWSMVEVYMLGLFVAYTKLADLADVTVLAAGYALGALMVLQAMTESCFDREAVWRAMERLGRVGDPARLAATLHANLASHLPTAGLIACQNCAFTVRGASGTDCPRCGGIVHARKPDAVARSWALLVAATILYIPANLLPILTAVELGKGQPATIIGGVRQLMQAGMYPLALLVFFASITVPAVKLLGLGTVLVTTQLRSRRRLRDRSRLFRVVEAIGRWSMIDMFMLSILVALVQLGFIASVTPGDGAVAFAGVVVLTMLAAMAFDPRVMWDAAFEARIVDGRLREAAA
jgi:paraquat-inducible protein A